MTGATNHTGFWKSILPIIVFSNILLWACEKSISEKKALASRILSQQEIQQKISGMNNPIEYTRFIPAETQRVTEEGKSIDILQLQKLHLLGTGPGCYPIVEPEAIIESHSIMRNNCSTNDFQVHASFIISSVNSIVTTNPNNSNQKTRGRVIITNTITGTNIINENNIQPVSISIIGPDPYDPSRTRHRITFTAQSIAFANYIDNYSIRVGLFFYTECEEESQYPYTAVATIANLGSLPICEIVHPIYYNAPYSGTSGFIAGVANCVSCCFSPYPTQQEIQISDDPNFANLKHNEVPVGQPTIPTIIGIGDYYQWQPPAGTNAIRYLRFRNKGTNGCNGPWSTTKIVTIP